MTTLKLITDATVEPVTLAEAKLQLRLETDITTEDARVTRLIQAAREDAEHRLGRRLCTQTWECVLDAFPEAEIDLRKPPIAAITSVVYIDENGDSQTMDSALYSLDADTSHGWLLPAIDTTWPATLDTANAVRVRFTTGVATAALVPAAVRDWILLRVESLYRNKPMDGHHDRLLDGATVYGT